MRVTFSARAGGTAAVDPSRLERVFVRWARQADGGLMSLIVLSPTPWRPREVKSSLSFWNLKEKSGGTIFSQESVILEGGDFKCTQMILTPRWQGKGERKRERNTSCGWGSFWGPDSPCDPWP